jgi:ABC-type Fe3+-siderophore transport system permease subunit
MSILGKMIIMFVASAISFVILYMVYKDDEYSPFVPIFCGIGLATFAVGLILFLTY